MRRDDNISRLFQNSQHNLEERPSNRAWQRLEQKLDAKKARHRRLIYRYVSTVAAVIAVLAMITAISVFDFPQNKEMANQTTTETPTIAMNNEDTERLEEFKEKEGINKTVTELLEEQEATQKEEGIDIYVEEEDYKNDTKEPIAQHIPKPAPPKRVSTKTTKPVIKKETPTMPEVEEVINDVEMTEEAPSIKTPTPSPAAQKSDLSDNMSKAKAEKAKMASKRKVLDKMRSKRKARTAAKTTSTAPKPSKELEIKPESTGYQNQMQQPKLDVSKVALTDFKWLEGEWEATKKGKAASYEKWEKKSRNTLVGEGYLINPDGKKSFTETIKIRKKGGHIYYYTKLEEDGDLVKFKLIQFDGRLAVFENKDIDFPQQIILEKKGGSTFSTIFQNTQNMSTVQEKQLKHRNNISRERATRMMKRRTSAY